MSWRAHLLWAIGRGAVAAANNECVRERRPHSIWGWLRKSPSVPGHPVESCARPAPGEA